MYPAVRETDAWYHEVALADRQPCPWSQQGEEDKKVSNLTEGKHMQGDGDWSLSLLREEGAVPPLAHEVPLANRYEALGKEGKELVWNQSEATMLRKFN